MDRRKFIQNVGLGAIPIIGGTLASCESVNSPTVNANWTDDFNIMKVIASAEAIMINTYQHAIENKLTGDNIALAQLFQSHHRDHFNAYNDTLAAEDWAPVSLGNDMDSRYDTNGNENETLQLVLQLEFEAAQFYYSNIVENISTAKVRMLFTNILPLEMGHVVSLKSALGLDDPNGATGMFEDFTNGL